MLKKNKIYKGEYGYIKYQRKMEIIKTIILLALSVGLYVLGFLTTGSNKNLLTFVAILGVLPMARFAISAVLFIRANGCSEESFVKIVSAGVAVDYYDLYMTSYDKNFALSASLLKHDCFVAFTEDEKMDIAACETHIKGILKNCGGESISVKVYNDLDKFTERLRELSQFDNDTKNSEFIRDNILNVSI